MSSFQKDLVKKCETLTLYTRALITPACTRKILIGEGMLFCFKLLRTIVVMSNRLRIVQVNSSIVHFAIQLFDRSKLGCRIILS